METDNKLREVKNLDITFNSDEGLARADDAQCFTTHKGKTLGIVSESGSGKSVTTQSIIRLL